MIVIRRLPPNEKKWNCRIWNECQIWKIGISEFWNEKPFQKIGIFGIVPKFHKFRKKALFNFNVAFLSTEFASVSWGDRSTALAPKASEGKFSLTIGVYGHAKFQQQKIPGLRELFRSCKLNLSEIVAKIFPAQLSTVIKGAKRVSAYLKKK